MLIVRAPFSWAWRKPGPSKRCCGVKFLFPVTLGVQNFDLEGLLAGEIPQSIEQASFLPGVELELPRSERWTLRVRAQLGWGTEIGGAHESAFIYSTGVRSRLIWPEFDIRPAWISGVQWAGHKPEHAASQDLARLTNGVELHIAVPRWQFRGEPMQLIPHVLNDRYFEPVDFFSIVDEAFESVDTEWEIGLAAGRSRPFSVLGIEFDRVGVAFRFSDDSRGIRLLFGSIF